jgi:hypothetical protein
MLGAWSIPRIKITQRLSSSVLDTISTGDIGYRPWCREAAWGHACFIVTGRVSSWRAITTYTPSCYKTFQIVLTVNWPRFSPHGYGPHRRFSASLWTRACPSSRRVRHATGSRKSSGKGMHGGRFACRGACTGLTIANVVAGCHRRTCCDRGGSRRGRCCLPGSHSCGAHLLISHAGSFSGQCAKANIGASRLRQSWLPRRLHTGPGRCRGRYRTVSIHPSHKVLAGQAPQVPRSALPPLRKAA